jgi:prepilin-type N-terminal cleavage/methylation domain-containing protein
MRALRSHGLTLVELLVVIAILGIAASAAIPFLSSTGPERLDAASQAFADAIRFARNEAIRTGIPHGFAITTDPPAIRLFSADMTTSPPTPVYDMRDPLSRQPYTVDLAAQPYLAVDSVSSSARYHGSCSSTGETLFDGHGTPYCRKPYPVFLEQASLVFRIAGRQRVLTLDGSSGRVSVQ